MIRIPEKQIIVNNVNQVRALKYDKSATYIDIVTPAAATDGFALEGFTEPVLFKNLKAWDGANLRIKAQAAVAAAKQVATFTTNAVVGSALGEPFRIVWDSADKTPTEFQNQPLEKHFQVSIDPANVPVNATAIQIANSMVAAINADKYAPVIAANGGTAVITLTAKNFNESFKLYTKPASQGGLITGTFAVTTPVTRGINTYDELKSINWATGLDFDRNVEYFPEYLATYKSYKFIIQSTGFMKDANVANAQAPISETECQLWVKTGLALITTLDLIIADANGALA